MTPERDIQHDIRLALGREPDLVLWRLSQCAVKVDGRWYRGGLVPGAADLVGIVGPRGRWFCLEIKTARGRVSEDQESFGGIIHRLGGFYCVVRSVDEARAALARARKGERE